MGQRVKEESSFDQEFGLISFWRITDNVFLYIFKIYIFT